MSDVGAPPLVMIADDDSVTRAMVSSWLTGSGYEAVAARDGEEALRLAGERTPDLLLVDVVMPGLDGYAVCRAVQAGSQAAPPVIVLTGHGQTAGVTGFEAGAVAYILKPFDQEDLVAHVAAALRTKAASDELARQATHDPLTGLLNRRAVDAQSVGLVALARRHDRALSCLKIDIDDFTAVNEVHGHAAGDDVLREAARRLFGSCRISDVVARYGGGEFILLLPETAPYAAVVLADKLRAALAGTPVETGGAFIPVRASIGVAGLTDAMETPESLIAAADDALRRAKTLGRDRTEVHHPLAAPA